MTLQAPLEALFVASVAIAATLATLATTLLYISGV